MDFSKEHIEDIVQAMPGAVAVYELADGDLLMPFYSPGLPEMMGFTPEEYRQRVAGDNMGLVAEADQASINQAIQQMLQDGHDVHVSYRARFKDGWHWMAVHGKIMGTYREHTVIMAEFMDTTRESRMHEELLDQISDALYVCDLNTYELFFLNKRARALWQVEGDTFGKPCYQVIRGFDAPCSWCPLAHWRDSDRNAYLEKWGGPDDAAYLHIEYSEIDWYTRASLCAVVKDATVEETAKQDLHQAEQELDEIVNNIPSGIGIFDVVDRTVRLRYLNDGYYRMLSTTPEDRRQFAGDAALDAVHPDDRSALVDEVQKSIDEHRQLYCQVRILTGTGAYRWASVRATHMRMSNGAERFYAAYSDIDNLMALQSELEKSKAEAERQLSSERLRAESLRGGILAVSCFNVTQDRIVDLNNDENLSYEKVNRKQAEEDAVKVDPRVMLQCDETKDILLSAAESIPDPQQRADFIRACGHVGILQAYERGERSRTLEYRRRTGKGLIWVSTRIEMMPDPQTGDILAFYYTTDINSQKIERLIDARILRDDYEFVGVVETAKRQLHVLASNRTSTSHPAGAVMDHDGEFVDSFLKGTDERDKDSVRRASLFDHVLEMLKEQPEYTHAFVATVYGKRRRKQLRYGYLDDTQEYVFVTGADITESTRLEMEQHDKLQAALQAAEAANRAKSDFLSRMSHDIRTPLNGVIGLTELARDESDPAAVQGYLSKIDESGKFLLSLVNDILDVAKVESGAAELHPAPYSYGEFRHYVKSVVEPLCAARNVTLQLQDISPDTTIVIDRLRINRVVFNLLSNAVKFTPESGKVLLKTTATPTGEGTADVTLQVVDDGPGMSEEFQHHLFEPFSQEHTGINEQRKGTGLGLAIVKEFVDLMGGTVAVESQPGHGSTFTVTLHVRIVQAPERPAPSKAHATTTLSGKHFLLAEDNLINGEIAEKLLQKQGATLQIVTDGQQAVTAFAASEPGTYDAILMDVRMPVMDGLEATRIIRAMDRADAQKIPIIAMTANAFADDVQACAIAGMNAHVAKPVNPETLFETIRTHLA